MTPRVHICIDTTDRSTFGAPSRKPSSGVEARAPLPTDQHRANGLVTQKDSYAWSTSACSASSVSSFRSASESTSSSHAALFRAAHLRSM